ncbi:hypothetical protein MIR68_003126 [Amoeboaphelidium protococcarum]|nr:hypothetical protein MIR68_003126 [Amoeboaphelidium protococcarum]
MSDNTSKQADNQIARQSDIAESNYQAVRQQLSQQVKQSSHIDVPYSKNLAVDRINKKQDDVPLNINQIEMNAADFEARRMHLIKHGVPLQVQDDSQSPTGREETLRGTAGDQSAKSASIKKRKAEQQDPISGNYLGPWRGCQDDDDDGDSELQRFLMQRDGQLDSTAQSDSLLLHRDVDKQQELVDIDQTQSREYASIYYGPQSLLNSWWKAPSDQELKGSSVSKITSQVSKCRHNFSVQSDSSPVNAIDLYPRSNHLLIAAYSSGIVRVWKLYGDYKLLRDYRVIASASQQKKQQNHSVTDVKFLSDELQFLSSSKDGVVRLWDLRDGQCLKQFVSDQGALSLAVMKDDFADRFFSGYEDGLVNEWSISSGVVQCEYNSHIANVNNLLALDNSHFVSTSADGTLRVWECGRYRTIRLFNTEKDGAHDGMSNNSQQSNNNKKRRKNSVGSRFNITSMALHPDGKEFVVQTCDGLCKFSNSSDQNYRVNRKQLFSIESTSIAKYHSRLCISPDGKYLATADNDGRLIIYDYHTTDMVRKAKAHQTSINQVLWTQQFGILTACKDSNIKLWQ